MDSLFFQFFNFVQYTTSDTERVKVFLVLVFNFQCSLKINPRLPSAYKSNRGFTDSFFKMYYAFFSIGFIPL